MKGTSIADIRAAIERAADDEPSLSQDVAPIVMEELRNQLVRDGGAGRSTGGASSASAVLAGHGLAVAFQPIWTWRRAGPSASRRSRASRASRGGPPDAGSPTPT